MMGIGWSASDPSILPSWSKTAGSYDVLAWPDRARPEHPSNTVTQVAGLKCYQRRHLNTPGPQSRRCLDDPYFFLAASAAIKCYRQSIMGCYAAKKVMGSKGLPALGGARGEPRWGSGGPPARGTN